MIDDEEHPDWVAVRNALFQQVATMAANEPFGDRLIEKLQELCDSATRQAKVHDIDFPKMVVAFFRARRLIRIWRADADRKLTDDYVRQTIVDMPEMTFPEIVAGFKRAFPNYVMSDWVYYKTTQKNPPPESTDEGLENTSGKALN